MGEVYRAHDTMLGRDVAIKVLPEAFASDSDRLARLRREARILASLNHPNIGGIYGLEQRDGRIALVMELVEGEDLSQRISRGALPMPCCWSCRPSLGSTAGPTSRLSATRPTRPATGASSASSADTSPGQPARSR